MITKSFMVCTLNKGYLLIGNIRVIFWLNHHTAEGLKKFQLLNYMFTVGTIIHCSNLKVKGI